MQVHNYPSDNLKVIPIDRKKNEAIDRDRYIAVYLKEKIELIDTNNIVFLKSDSNYCHIHLNNGNDLLASQTLKRFSERLGTTKFMRVHQSYIVRKNHIRSFSYSDQTISLSDGSTIPVSRKQRSKVFDFFDNYRC